MVEMFLIVLYKKEGLETDALKLNLEQYWSDSCVTVAIVILWMSSSGRTITQTMI